MEAAMTLHRICNNKSGNVSLIVGLSMVPLAALAGLAIDVNEAYKAKAQLGNALDAAALAIGTSTSTNSTVLNGYLTKYLAANFPSSKYGTPYNVSMTAGTLTIDASASLDVKTSFLQIVGFKTITVSATTEVTKQVTGLEVALALDNTGSMVNDSKIVNLKAAATNLVNQLIPSGTTSTGVKIGIVPFVTSVNIGPSYSSSVSWGTTQWAPWISSSGIAVQTTSYSKSPVNGTTETGALATTWKGCVKEQNYPNDVTASTGPWAPYYWPLEPVYKISTQGTKTSASCTNPGNGTSSTTVKGSTGTWYPSIDETVTDTNTSQAGPNMSCGPAITPLTGTSSTLTSAITYMEPWGGNYTGTMTHLGVTWAWRLLAPQAPFNDPIAYNDPKWKKVIIILTDGANENPTASSTCTSFNGSGTGPISGYSGYGFLQDEGKLNASSSFSPANITTLSGKIASWLSSQSLPAETDPVVASEDELLREACTNAKAQGITIFSIILDTASNPVTSTQQTLFQFCATTPSNYYLVTDSSTLPTVFSTIGGQISNLRLTK
jgi:Flp pilus assembly protein TadG